MQSDELVVRIGVVEEERIGGESGRMGRGQRAERFKEGLLGVRFR